MDDRYLSVAELVQYSGLSERTLRRSMHHPTHPLPTYRVRGRTLFLKSEFDHWLRTTTARESKPTRAQLVAVSMPLKGVR